MTHLARLALGGLAWCATSACESGAGSQVAGTRERVLVKALYGPLGKGDKAFNDAIYLGLLTARQERDAQLVEAAPADTSEAVAIFHAWLSEPPAEQPELLIIAQEYTAMVVEAGCALAGRRLLHFEGAVAPCEAIRTVGYGTFAPAYLAGVVAAKHSKTGVVAALGGQAIPAVEEAIGGFTAGVESAAGKLEVVILAPADDGFNNPDLAFERATGLYAAADVIFSVAGYSTTGVIAAAKALPGRFVVGMDTDQSPLGRGVVLASVVKRVDATVIRAVSDLDTGGFSGGAMVQGMADGETALVLNPRFPELEAHAAGAYQAALEAEAAALGSPP